MLGSGKGRFFIISKDREKLADFRFVADQAGILWQVRPDACLIFGWAAARDKAASLLAALAFGPWEQRLLARLARERYECFDERELRLLQDKALRLTQDDDFCWGLFAGGQREQRLAAALAEHLGDCPRLDLEGFWRFRMEGYREYLQTLLSIAADELLSEQEDREYLVLVRDFMADQPPGGEVEVYLLRQDRYDICLKTAEGLRFYEGGRLTGCEDMLLYSLLTLAPQSLTVHVEQPLHPALYQLLTEMFGARLTIRALTPLAALDRPRF